MASHAILYHPGNILYLGNLSRNVAATPSVLPTIRSSIFLSFKQSISYWVSSNGVTGLSNIFCGVKGACLKRHLAPNLQVPCIQKRHGSPTSRCIYGHSSPFRHLPSRQKIQTRPLVAIGKKLRLSTCYFPGRCSLSLNLQRRLRTQSTYTDVDDKLARTCYSKDTFQRAVHHLLYSMQFWEQVQNQEIITTHLCLKSPHSSKRKFVVFFAVSNISFTAPKLCNQCLQCNSNVIIFGCPRNFAECFKAISICVKSFQRMGNPFVAASFFHGKWRFVQT